MQPDEFVQFSGSQKASAILRTTVEGAAAPAMEAALRAGFKVIEFTLTTPAALDLIGEFSRRDGIVHDVSSSEFFERHAARTGDFGQLVRQHMAVPEQKGGGMQPVKEKHSE